MYFCCFHKIKGSEKPHQLILCGRNKSVMFAPSIVQDEAGATIVGMFPTPYFCSPGSCLTHSLCPKRCCPHQGRRHLQSLPLGLLLAEALNHRTTCIQGFPKPWSGVICSTSSFAASKPQTQCTYIAIAEMEVLATIAKD